MYRKQLPVLWHRAVLLFALAAFASLTGRVASAVDTFQGLGDLPGGVFESRSTGVSADGTVVVGFSESASGREAFRWTAAGGIVGLGDLSGGGFSSTALGASADGSVVVGVGDPGNGSEAFRWTAGGGMVGLGDLPGGNSLSFARNTSPDGSVLVGLSGSTSGFEAFRWTAADGMVGLGDLPGGSFESNAAAVSNDGTVVVGGSRTATEYEAFRWTASGGMVSLANALTAPFPTDAHDLSADGTVVVGGGPGPSHEPWIWTAADGIVRLSPGISGDAEAISDDGNIVVGDNDQEAFIWDAVHGMRDLKKVLVEDFGLDLTGWTLNTANSISRAGRAITGYGTGLNGTEAWRVLLDPKWVNPSSGSWDTFGNWALGGSPTFAEDVFLTPNSSLVVTGPSAGGTVKSLTLGALSGFVTLDILPTGTFTVNNLTTIQTGGRLIGNGIFRSLGGIDNSGEIHLGNNGLQIVGGILQNMGLLQGNGRIETTVANAAAGEIVVATGNQIFVTGAGNTNAGRINLTGGTLWHTQDFTNLPNGMIVGQGTLRADGGITNKATVAFSGQANFIGDVNNNVSGLIIVSGGGPTTFFDDVVNDGEIRVSDGSSATYFGSVSGLGNFTGTGTNFFEGDLDPGNSAALVDFEGSVVLGTNNVTTMELGGLLQGSDYDAIAVAGTISLDGTLDVTLLNGFIPSSGDVFEIVTADAGVSGVFNIGTLPDLGPLLTLDVTYSPFAVLLSAVPALTGDFDLDGDVDGADFLHWQRGESPTPLSESDLADWNANYGATNSLTAASAVVPEPSNTVALTLAMFLHFGFGYQRKNRI